MSKNITITCPHCKKESIWSMDNPFRPFCCERCKLIDLGDWIEERHTIPGESQEIANSDFTDDYPTQ